MSGFMPKRLDASKKEAYDLAVLKFVVADGRPFETTAGVGFQNLCAVITDGAYAYKPPHPTTLSRQLNDLSANLKQKFIDKLKPGIGDSRPYGLRGIYGRFDSKIRFKIESDGRFDSRFDSNAKRRFAAP